MDQKLVLKTGQVHLWYVLNDNSKQRDWLAHCHGLISSDENDRYQRFVFEKDRNQFLIARALLRRTLSRYSVVQPQDWRFETNEFGKPEIESGQNLSQLRFNLSHCDGLILCGVTIGKDIGVDCENTNRPVDINRLSPRVFSTSEQEFLASVPKAKLNVAFFRLWTLKEAYVKARGIGLAIPLKEFSVEYAQSSRIEVSFGPEIDDRSKSWQFFQPMMSKPHIVAAAVNQRYEDKLNFELHEFPLFQST